MLPNHSNAKGPALATLLCLLLFGSWISLFAQQAKPTSQLNIQTHYIDVGGYKLRLQVAGSAAPTVVLDYGFTISS